MIQCVEQLPWRALVVKIERRNRLRRIDGGIGIGITALIPFIKKHWNVKLIFSVKESGRS